MVAKKIPVAFSELRLWNRLRECRQTRCSRPRAANASFRGARLRTLSAGILSGTVVRVAWETHCEGLLPAPCRPRARE